jgi:hypothetical protein
MNKKSKEYQNIINIEKQISSMLEKVLIDDDNEDLTTTDYSSYRNDNLNESIEPIIYSNFIRNQGKKPKTVSYQKNYNFQNLFNISPIYNSGPYNIPNNKR